MEIKFLFPEIDLVILKIYCSVRLGETVFSGQDMDSYIKSAKRRFFAAQPKIDKL